MNSEFEDGGMEGAPAKGQSNVLGIVGFVLAFCLSPIGLLLSLVALMKQPRGFAIAGVIVGVLGTAIWGFGGFIIAKGGPAMAKVFVSVADIEQIRTAVNQYENTNGALPSDLSQLTLTEGAKTDEWGNPYVFTPNPADGTWSVTTGFADGQIGTADDVTITSDMSSSQIGEMFGNAMQDVMRAGNWRREVTGASSMQQQAPGRQPIESNGLGIAAFIVSLVGIISCGLLSPIGLVMSLVAVGKRPRGFAIAGIIIGVLGSCMVLISLVFPLFILVGLALAGAGAAAAGIAGAIGSPSIQGQLEMLVISSAIVAFEEENDRLPESLQEVIDGGYFDDQDLGDWDLFNDYWGNPYFFEALPEPDSEGVMFRLFSVGEDGETGTPDDLEFDLGSWRGFIDSMNN